MKKIFFAFLFCFISSSSFAENSFHPEVQSTLEAENFWAATFFKESKTEAITAFRAWMPYKAADVWDVLTDTNSWKKVHSDYSDSRTLDKNQFDLLEMKKPADVKSFYEIIGQEEFPSFHGRKKGGVWTSYVFQRFNMPWPLSDRWLVIKIKNDESKADQNYYRYDYKGTVGNFKSLKGYWELVPIPGKPGWTEFRGEYKADPGITVPKFLAKNLFKASMKKSVNENIEVLKKLGK